MQNRINLAMPLLPDVVKQAGVITRKRNPDILLVLAIYSPKGRYDQLYLSNFATIYLKDEISRVEGVGDCQQFGQQDYSMRIWVDPDKLSTLNLSASDVSDALREQNRQVAAGVMGGTGDWSNAPGLKSLGSIVRYSPAIAKPKPAVHAYPITVLGRLSKPEEFEDIVIRTDGQGRRIRIKDVGRVETGGQEPRHDEPGRSVCPTPVSPSGPSPTPTPLTRPSG